MRYSSLISYMLYVLIPIPRYPYGAYEWGFNYDPTDHDGDGKSFLGETGRFNGEDAVDIIVRQPATAR